MAQGELAAEHEFERRVAAIYRATGAEIDRNVVLAGTQIDILVRETTSSGAYVTRVVECKNFRAPVNRSVVQSFAGLVHLLRDRGLADTASVVAAAGFTEEAIDAGRIHKIDLIAFPELERRARDRNLHVDDAEQEVAAADNRAAGADSPDTFRAFVVMPFSQELNDLYMLGIRDVAERLGLIVERGDEIEHNAEIMGVIVEKIKSCDVVIAETTDRNANVFYEIGYAHGCNKQTILLSRRGADLPFDTSGINHVMYSSIIDLRERLERRLLATLNAR